MQLLVKHRALSEITVLQHPEAVRTPKDTTAPPHTTRTDVIQMQNTTMFTAKMPALTADATFRRTLKHTSRCSRSSTVIPKSCTTGIFIIQQDIFAQFAVTARGATISCAPIIPANAGGTAKTQFVTQEAYREGAT